MNSLFLTLVYWIWNTTQIVSRLMRKLSDNIKYTKYWKEESKIDMLKESLEINNKLISKIWL